MRKQLSAAIEIVEFDRWVDVVKESPSQPQNVKSNPACKLPEFFEAFRRQEVAGHTMPAFDTSRTTMRSETMEKLDAVKEERMATWIKQWGLSHGEESV